VCSFMCTDIPCVLILKNGGHHVYHSVGYHGVLIQPCITELQVNTNNSIEQFVHKQALFLKS
jgi:hypothetical protein